MSKKKNNNYNKPNNTENTTPVTEEVNEEVTATETVEETAPAAEVITEPVEEAPIEENAEVITEVPPVVETEEIVTEQPKEEEVVKEEAPVEAPKEEVVETVEVSNVTAEAPQPVEEIPKKKPPVDTSIFRTSESKEMAPPVKKAPKSGGLLTYLVKINLSPDKIDIVRKRLAKVSCGYEPFIEGKSVFIGPMDSYETAKKNQKLVFAAGLKGTIIERN